MLDSRYLASSPRLQPVGTSTATSKIIIMRRRVKENESVNGGLLGETNTEYYVVYRGWPASIVPSKGELENIAPGQTERGDMILNSQYRRLSDGGLLIRERDIVIDMNNSQRFLVLWSYDPMNTHLQIVAGLKYGVINEGDSGLEVQGKC